MGNYLFVYASKLCFLHPLDPPSETFVVLAFHFLTPGTRMRSLVWGDISFWARISCAAVEMKHVVWVFTELSFRILLLPGNSALKSQLMSSRLKSGLVSSGGMCPYSFYLARIVSQSCPLQSSVENLVGWVFRSLVLFFWRILWVQAIRPTWARKKAGLVDLWGNFTCLYERDFYVRLGYVRPLELLLNQCWDRGSSSPMVPIHGPTSQTWFGFNCWQWWWWSAVIR